MSIRLGLQKLVSSHLYEGARIEIIIQKITSTRTSVDRILQWCVNLNGIEDNEKKISRKSHLYRYVGWNNQRVSEILTGNYRTLMSVWIETLETALVLFTQIYRTKYGARIEITSRLSWKTCKNTSYVTERTRIEMTTTTVKRFYS